MGEEALPPLFRSVEEQLFRFTQWISGQPDRHAFVRLAGENVPSPVTVPTVRKPLTMPWYTKRRTGAIVAKLPFALPMSDALARVMDHESRLAETLLDAAPNAEPVRVKRTIVSRVRGTGRSA
jgi:hypothetical protein